MTLIFTILLGSYLFFLVWLWLGWERLDPVPEEPDNLLSATVVVAVRNEEKNIGNLLSDLSVQENISLEIIIVDDHSTDDTPNLISAFVDNNKAVDIQLLTLDKGQGKKQALSFGVSKACNEYILTTDGDCRVSISWASKMVRTLAGINIQMVVGAVTIKSGKSLFGKLQALEFASLMGTIWGTLGWRLPIMCNGASLAFNKSVFEEIGGYKGYDQVASGDDVFLMHKVNEKHPGSVISISDEDVLVETGPVLGIADFFNQRKRWASKWKNYSNIPTRLIGAYIILLHLAIVLSFFAVFMNLLNWYIFIECLLAKAVMEYLFLSKVQKALKGKFHFVSFIILQFTYSIYALVSGFAGLGKTYIWKERKTK